MIEGKKEGLQEEVAEELVSDVASAKEAAKEAKGDRTRARILDEAVELASVGGLGTLTIGPLAERLGLSKSGLFAHFRSKEALQVETLERAAILFTDAVIAPLRDVPDKPKRLRIFFETWIKWLSGAGLSGGCPILAAAIEFDDVPGPVHDAAARHFTQLAEVIRRLARHAHPDGDIELIVAGVSGLAMSHLVRIRLLGDAQAHAVSMRAFDALVAASGGAKSSVGTRASGGAK